VVQNTASRKQAAPSEEATGDYKMVLDEMAAAMNVPADAEKGISKPVVKRSKSARASKYNAAAASSAANGVGIG